MKIIASFETSAMNKKAAKRIEKSKNRGPVDLDQQDPVPDPINSSANDRANEPLLGTVQYEKMVHVNDKDIPIAEDSLSASEIMERAGFAPSEYVLYESTGEGSEELPLDKVQTVEIKNNMRLHAVLETQ